MGNIKLKTGYCPECGNTEPKPLMKKLCLYHYGLSRPKKPIARKPVKINTCQNNTGKNKSGTLSVKELLVRAELVFNRWIRKRDSHSDNTFKCISCGLWKSIKEADCGHFFPKTYAATRFHEDNCHSECISCNRIDPDHLLGYAINLKVKIGTERFENLNTYRKANHKWDRSELMDIIEKYK